MRELSQRTAQVLARVRAGETVEITDRGKPVARIVPATADRYDQLVAAGMMRGRGGVRAGPVHPGDHERALALGKREGLEKAAHVMSHQSEIARVTGKLDFLLLRFLHRAGMRLTRGPAFFAAKLTNFPVRATSFRH